MDYMNGMESIVFNVGNDLIVVNLLSGEFDPSAPPFCVENDDNRSE